ncbi:uncharacterized protein PRCAT00005689001 [Priceomyces carsonii]|uniref:uncharacterized protein n=1 Tax=Priceomyces carsonii TaxID=28549 RepID=UPI002ED814B9|nr:unnamed protein product [Priceomyces carsonii]
MNAARDKENRDSKTKLSTCKSYSILRPSLTNVNCDGYAGRLKNERLVSLSTGLVKFSLSPGKKGSTEKLGSMPSLCTRKVKLPVYVPIDQASRSIEHSDIYILETEESLLNQLLTKQKELVEFERSVEQTKVQLIEISRKLERLKGQDNLKNEPKETQKVSFLSLRKCASSIFETTRPRTKYTDVSHTESNPSLSGSSTYLHKLQHQFSNNVNELKLKEDFSYFLNRQSVELDELTNKTSNFVKGLFENFSPLKNSDDIRHEEIAESSFNFDNLQISTSTNTKNDSNIIYNMESASEERLRISSSDADHSILDIDDYTSDEN